MTSKGDAVVPLKCKLRTSKMKRAGIIAISSVAASLAPERPASVPHSSPRLKPRRLAASPATSGRVADASSASRRKPSAAGSSATREQKLNNSIINKVVWSLKEWTAAKVASVATNRRLPRRSTVSYRGPASGLQPMPKNVIAKTGRQNSPSSPFLIKTNLSRGAAMPTAPVQAATTATPVAIEVATLTAGAVASLATSSHGKPGRRPPQETTRSFSSTFAIPTATTTTRRAVVATVDGGRATQGRPATSLLPANSSLRLENLQSGTKKAVYLLMT